MKEVWIGLAKVETKDENLGFTKAYVNVAGLAKNKDQFRKFILDFFANMNIELLRLEEAKALDNKSSDGRSDYFTKLAMEVNREPHRPPCSTFHCYD